jgi:hypothetical protein
MVCSGDMQRFIRIAEELSFNKQVLKELDEDINAATTKIVDLQIQGRHHEVVKAQKNLVQLRTTRDAILFMINNGE